MSDFIHNIRTIKKIKTERELENSLIKRFSYKVSKKIKLKRYCIPLACALIGGFFLTAYTWDKEENPFISFMNIFNNLSSGIFLFINVYNPDNEDISYIEQNLQATQEILTNALNAKDEYNRQLKQLNEAIQSFKEFGTDEFKTFVENMKVENIDKERFKNIVDRQKLLIDKLSKTITENEKRLDDDNLIKFAIRLKNFTSKETSNEIEKSNLKKETKDNINLLIEESRKIKNLYEEQTNILRNFSFHRKTFEEKIDIDIDDVNDVNEENITEYIEIKIKK